MLPDGLQAPSALPLSTLLQSRGLQHPVQGDPLRARRLLRLYLGSLLLPSQSPLAPELLQHQ
jgi:hypothetical protein